MARLNETGMENNASTNTIVFFLSTNFVEIPIASFTSHCCHSSQRIALLKTCFPVERNVRFRLSKVWTQPRHNPIRKCDPSPSSLEISKKSLKCSGQTVELSFSSRIYGRWRCQSSNWTRMSWNTIPCFDNRQHFQLTSIPFVDSKYTFQSIWINDYEIDGEPVTFMKIKRHQLCLWSDGTCLSAGA